MDSHITENLMSLSVLDSILKIFFREPTSVNVRVVLLVEDDKTMYIMATSALTKRWTLTLLEI